MWEWAWPRRKRTVAVGTRWLANFGLGLLNVGVVRLLGAGVLVTAATWMQDAGWGWMNRWDWTAGPGSSPMLRMVVGVVLMDFAIYIQHVLAHGLPIIWRFHALHHSDMNLDASSALRFHPIEILVSLAYKLGMIALFGVPASAVLVHEILLNGLAIFNHGNLRMPRAMDRVLRFLIVTPDMHRIHHSVEVGETNSNYGNVLSWWDVLFGTYVDQPRGGQLKMTIGLKEYRDPKKLGWDRVLLLPFRRF